MMSGGASSLWMVGSVLDLIITTIGKLVNLLLLVAAKTLHFNAETCSLLICISFTKPEV